MNNRYNRHIILSEVGQEGQERLLNAKVLVIGAGGLGCPILQYLTAAGIGSIGIIDFDFVDISNLQRQILFGTESIGVNKAIAAKNRLEDLNPTIKIHAMPKRLSPKNAVNLFKRYDLIVDGTDNFITRYLINDSAIICNKPVVYGAVFKYEGQVSVFNYKNGPSYRCLFPTPPLDIAVANCSEVGVLGVLPGIIGTMMANEVIKIILQFDQVLSGKLLCYNSRSTEISILKINRNQLAIQSILNNPKLIEDYQEKYCDYLSIEISELDREALGNIQFIDVRELHEKPKLKWPACVSIPINSLENKIDNIEKDKTTVVFCQSGARSKVAAKYLRKIGINDVFSFKGGIFNLIEDIKIN